MAHYTNTNTPRIKRDINGILLLDKPAGLTSNAVLAVIKRLYNAEKAGHTGTLDPFATGLLPVGLGEATKFSAHLIGADKTYLATMKLGITTSTGDIEGDVLETRQVEVERTRIEAAMRGLVGEISQVPPMFSALKHQGRPLYEYARAGIELERAARRVTIRGLDLIAFDADVAVFRVACSKGTYVRTLAEDIGRALGCGAHLTALRRERSGGFGLENAVTPAAIEALPPDQRGTLLLPVDALVGDLPRLECDAATAARLRLGQRVPARQPDGRYRAYDPAGELIGLVNVAADVIRPERLVTNAGRGRVRAAS